MLNTQYSQWVGMWLIVPRHGEAIGGGDIEMLGVRPSVRLCVTKLVSAITSDFMLRFTQYLTQ